MFANYLIHDGPDDLQNEAYATAGCIEIWAVLDESPEVRVGRAVGIVRMGEQARRVDGRYF